MKRQNLNHTLADPIWLRHFRQLVLFLCVLALTSYTQFNPLPEKQPLSPGHNSPLPTRERYTLENGISPAEKNIRTFSQSSAAVESQADTSQSETIVSSFEGLNYGGQSPPDVQVASDGMYVMETVNTNVGIWTRQGTLIQSIPSSEFWGPGFSTRIYDSRVLYDSQSGRWFVSAEDFSSGLVLLRVSKTGNPTGNWWTFTLQAPTGCPDQPLLGVSDDKVAISTNNFTGCGFGQFIGAEYWILDKYSLTTGTLVYANFGPDTNYFSIQPVQSLTTTTTLYMVSLAFAGYFLWLFTVDGTPPGPVTITTTNLPITAAHSAPSAPQLGTNLVLLTADNRIQDAKWTQGKLWLTFEDGCQPDGDSQVRACIRIIQLDTTTTTIQQDFDFGANGKYYFYPALTPDNFNNLIVVFGYSSPQDYPGIMAATQAAGGSPNTLEDPIIIRSGTSSETTWCPQPPTCRYGDYFGARPDPSDPRTIWMAGEYGTPNGWSTRIAALYSLPVMNALQSGWNSITPPLNYDPCTPTITPDYNPTIIELNGVRFALRVLWQDNVGNSHRFAIYSQGTSPENVTSTDPCNITNTSGCLASSGTIDYTNRATTITFTPTISSNFTGPGTYEYYCQFHPSTMHGKLIVYKNPDSNRDGKVTILDIASVAYSYGSTPSSQNWNINADLDNNGRVDILDVAIAAFHYSRYIYAL